MVSAPGNLMNGNTASFTEKYGGGPDELGHFFGKPLLTELDALRLTAN